MQTAEEIAAALVSGAANINLHDDARFKQRAVAYTGQLLAPAELTAKEVLQKLALGLPKLNP